MNDLLDKILQLPTAQKIGSLVGIISLLLVAHYFYLYSPRADEISRLIQDIETARMEIQKRKALAANIPNLRNDLRHLDAMLQEAIAQLPDRKEIPNLLSSISTKAHEAGLDILLFRPRAENYQDFYAEIPVDIAVRGSFYSVVVFFDEVGRLSRLVNITNIDLKNPRVSGNQVLLETSALVTTFRFLDDAERRKIAAEKAKAAKK